LREQGSNGCQSAKSSEAVQLKFQANASADPAFSVAFLP
jgi:hypothetical protein